MSQLKNIVSMMLLAGAAAFAGAGCLAEGADDEAADDQAPAAGQAGSERTGDAKEACGCGFSSFGGWGGFGGIGGWGGFGGCGGWYPWSLSVYGPLGGCWGGCW